MSYFCTRNTESDSEFGNNCTRNIVLAMFSVCMVATSCYGNYVLPGATSANIWNQFTKKWQQMLGKNFRLDLPNCSLWRMYVAMLLKEGMGNELLSAWLTWYVSNSGELLWGLFRVWYVLRLSLMMMSSEVTGYCEELKMGVIFSLICEACICHRFVGDIMWKEHLA
jgi:hypothetical protein